MRVSAIIAALPAVLAVGALHATCLAGESYAIGRTATPEEIAGWDIDVSPSGANAWASLCGVTGNLPFSAGSSTGAGATTLPPGTELTVTPSPVRAQPTGSPGPGKVSVTL